MADSVAEGAEAAARNSSITKADLLRCGGSAEPVRGRNSIFSSLNGAGGSGGGSPSSPSGSGKNKAGDKVGKGEKGDKDGKGKNKDGKKGKMRRTGSSSGSGASRWRSRRVGDGDGSRDGKKGGMKQEPSTLSKKTAQDLLLAASGELDSESRREVRKWLQREATKHDARDLRETFHGSKRAERFAEEFLQRAVAEDFRSIARSAAGIDAATKEAAKVRRLLRGTARGVQILHAELDHLDRMLSLEDRKDSDEVATTLTRGGVSRGPKAKATTSDQRTKAHDAALRAQLLAAERRQQLLAATAFDDISEPIPSGRAAMEVSETDAMGVSFVSSGVRTVTSCADLPLFSVAGLPTNASSRQANVTSAQDVKSAGSAPTGLSAQLPDDTYEAVEIPLHELWYGDHPELMELVEIPDKLHVAVVLRTFEDAVSLAERASVLFRSDQPDLISHISRTRSALGPLLGDLVQELSSELEDATAASTSLNTQNVIGWLSRLGLGDDARRVYLGATSRRISHDIRQVRLQGDIASYISELSTLVFNNINRTCDNFKLAFVPDTGVKDAPKHIVGSSSSMLSGFVVWSIDELARFGELFRSQVFEHNTDDFRTMGICLDTAMAHCKLLDRKGLALSFAFEKMFHGSLVGAIRATTDRAVEAIRQAIDDDDFEASPQLIVRAQEEAQQSKDKTPATAREVRQQRRTRVQTVSSDQYQIMLTGSARQLYVEAQSMSSNFQRVASIALVPAMSEAFRELIGMAEERYEKRLSDPTLSEKQQIAILANSKHVTEDLAVYVLRQLEKKLERQRVHDFEKTLAVLATMHERTCDVWCSRTADRLVSEVLHWESMKYEDSRKVKDSDDSITVSKEFVDFFVTITKIRSNLEAIIGSVATGEQQVVSPLLRGVVEEVSVRIPEAAHLAAGANITGRGPRGVVQLTVDLRFFHDAASATQIASPRVTDRMEAAIALAREELKARNGAVPEMSTEWFTNSLSRSLEQHGPVIGL